jgi:hypothetical protein
MARNQEKEANVKQNCQQEKSSNLLNNIKPTNNNQPSITNQPTKQPSPTIIPPTNNKPTAKHEKHSDKQKNVEENTSEKPKLTTQQLNIQEKTINQEKLVTRGTDKIITMEQEEDKNGDQPQNPVAALLTKASLVATLHASLATPVTSYGIQPVGCYSSSVILGSNTITKPPVRT